MSHNNCLLQPTLHFNHPLLQFADITVNGVARLRWPSRHLLSAR